MINKEILGNLLRDFVDSRNRLIDYARAHSDHLRVPAGARIDDSVQVYVPIEARQEFLDLLDPESYSMVSDYMGSVTEHGTIKGVRVFTFWNPEEASKI